MSAEAIELTLNGKSVRATTTVIMDRNVMVTGKLAKAASIKGEDWLVDEPVPNPAAFLAALRERGLGADYFSFGQRFWQPKPRHPYHYDWDNIAAIPLVSYEDWWEKHVSHDLRKDVKRAEKRGLVLRTAEFNDDLVNGIRGIYNECRIRQGRHFWHYGKDFESVKRENSTYIERAEFIGAYVGEELIGFIKLVYCDRVARMMQILSKEKDQDKRPTNALIAKAVEVACARHCSYLTYGRYTYDNKKNSSIVQFKKRNGFEEILYPRYYIPLTARGAAVINMGLHLGFKRFIPEPLMYWLLDVRSKLRRQPAAETSVKTNETATTPAETAAQQSHSE